MKNAINKMKRSSKTDVLKGLPSLPDAPLLSDEAASNFIKQYVRFFCEKEQCPGDDYYAASITEFLQLMGGDCFIRNLLKREKRFNIYIVENNSTHCRKHPEFEWVDKYFAYAFEGKLVFSKRCWDNYSHRRVPTLMHETIHIIDKDEIHRDPDFLKIYNEAKSKPECKWDEYPFTAPSEYLASGTEWVIKNDVCDDGAERKRERLMRMDSKLYRYIVSFFIPEFLYRNDSFPGKCRKKRTRAQPS